MKHNRKKLNSISWVWKSAQSSARLSMQTWFAHERQSNQDWIPSNYWWKFWTKNTLHCQKQSWKQNITFSQSNFFPTFLPILLKINEYTAERLIQTERTNCPLKKQTINYFQFRGVTLHHHRLGFQDGGRTAILDRLQVWFEIDTK